jgi:glucose-1-phosphate cytidylyltransferase
VKAVILAGGLGTRLSEETSVKPKPMVEVGGKPILWHIMKIYAANGITDFIVCCGYKGYVIKEFFTNYVLHTADVSIDLASNKITYEHTRSEPWKVTLVDTGETTMTGGRLKRVKDYLDDETFCLTYGDGVGNINIKDAIKLHRDEGSLATLTAVQPPGRFGAFTLGNDTHIKNFHEKPHGDGAWVNGGYFVLEPGVIDHIEGDATVWESEPLETLAKAGQLTAYRHYDFWQPMDTLRDRKYLEDLWSSGEAPWKIW